MKGAPAASAASSSSVPKAAAASTKAAKAGDDGPAAKKPRASKKAGNTKEQLKEQEEAAAVDEAMKRGQFFYGQRVVMTGVMDVVGREEVEEMVRRYGGKVQGQVGKSARGRTHLVVTGPVLEDGRPVIESKKVGGWGRWVGEWVGWFCGSECGGGVRV